MIKKTKNISINILVTLTVLLSLLCICVGNGNAWFTTSQNRGVEVIVRVNEYNILLYQVTKNGEEENSTLVYTYKKNDRDKTSNYITLDKELLPDAFNELKLKVKNDDAGAGIYFKYQFKVFAITANSEEEININLDVDENFTLKNNYYYYTGGGANNILFTNPEEVVLFTGFTIPYNEFKTFNGGETIRIELDIQCCETNVGL